MLSNNFNDVLRSITIALKKHTELLDIDINATFSFMGVTSLRGVQIILDINNELDTKLKTHDLFIYPTPRALANYLAEKTNDIDTIIQQNSSNKKTQVSSHEPIAIIAMDCNLPGADNCESFWKNCALNRECLAFFNKHSGDSNNGIYQDVYARGILNDIEYFDAQFFNYSPRDASLSDPQHRLFIQAAWNALEQAGYASEDKTHGKVGVYASMNDSTYILDQHALVRSQANLTDRFALQRAMSSQFLATKVAYLLNCSGPSITVQTACSSSLVAVVLACQQLSSLECDTAIAGGVSIVTPQDRPYVYQPGNIYSPDGHCRPFDANAMGTVFSNGLGVVVLKRLSDAMRDQDSIISVIKGYSVNNDGDHKVSYAAPSMQGQLDCILAAQKIAKIEADSIQYIETHGTGTLVGDPIEIEALTKAFRQSTSKEQFCAIGSVKANIGHTHVAAGVAGLIKASMALKHQKIPPALHFETPNPDIDFKHSPFYVNTRLLNWIKISHPRRAAVSAFGVGGTNAHIILEEAPSIESYPPKRSTHILLLSAKSEKALQDYQDKLIDFLIKQEQEQKTSTQLADLAYTLQVGRNQYPYRTGVVCENITEAVSQLKDQKHNLQQGNSKTALQQKKIIFLFPGQGEQYINMSYELYQTEPIYKKWLDICLKIASQYVEIDLYNILFPSENESLVAQEKLFQTQYVHPILFSVEYALAKLFQNWGIIPDAMLGHSLGEYVVACLANVFSLEDAIHIVCTRGYAISQCEQGQMLSVPLSQDEAQIFCTDNVGLAVETASNLCVLSGSVPGIRAVQEKIANAYQDRSSRIKQLNNRHPFHSKLLVDAANPLFEVLETVSKKSPQVPYLSNLTGDWISDADITNKQYWIDHLLKTVKLSQCLKKLIDESEDSIFIEIGPGRSLLASLQMNTSDAINMVSTLSKDRNIPNRDCKNVALALKKLWCFGCDIDWKRFHKNENRRRIALPTYPFQKERYWIDQIYPEQRPLSNMAEINKNITFYIPSWICDPKGMGDLIFLKNAKIKRRWIIFANQSGLCNKFCQILLNQSEDLVKIFQEKDKNLCESSDYVINVEDQSQYYRVFKLITSDEIEQYVIAHFWSVENSIQINSKRLSDVQVLYQGFYSGIFIAQALDKFAINASVSWMMVTTGVHSILGDEDVNPLKSSTLSLCRVLPLENQNPKFHISHCDVDLRLDADTVVCYCNEIIKRLINDDLDCEINNTIALRNNKIWLPAYSTIPISEKPPSLKVAADNPATYLITGGLGGMGLSMAQWLSNQNNNCSIILLSRSEFPEQDTWNEWLNNHATENTVSKKICVLQDIISKGCHVEIIRADVADSNHMEELIPLIEKEFGIIRGIFHLAGVSGEGLVILKKIDEVQKVLRPKVQGLQVLINLFHEKELDFFIASSSLTAIAGGVGQIDYCAANIYLDSCLAQKPLKHCKRTLTINWNAWRSIGMAANVKQAKHCQLYAGNSVTPEQGIAIMDKLMEQPYAQVIVSRYSPANEIERISHTFRYAESQIQHLTDAQVESKPNPLNVYNIVKSGWTQVLGVSALDEKSSFYNCGGDSLALIQLISVIEKQIGIKITLQELSQYAELGAMVIFVENLINSGKETV